MLTLELPGHDVREDLKLLVRVRAEALVGLDSILVDHAQWTEGLVAWHKDASENVRREVRTRTGRPSTHGGLGKKRRRRCETS